MTETSRTTTPAPDPPERPQGQDEPPDTLQAIVVAIVLLRDLRDFLQRRAGDPEDLALRADALEAVLGRIRDRLDR